MTPNHTKDSCPAQDRRDDILNALNSLEYTPRLDAGGYAYVRDDGTTSTTHQVVDEVNRTLSHHATEEEVDATVAALEASLQRSQGESQTPAQAAAAAVAELLAKQKETPDLQGVFESAALLAQLPIGEYEVTKNCLKKLLGKELNLNSLDAAIREARPKAILRYAERPVYESTSEGLTVTDGATTSLLTNFTARIVAAELVDDGFEQCRRFSLEVVEESGRQTAFSLPAEELGEDGWPMRHVGRGAIVYPCRNVAQHLRAAIQTVSTNVVERQMYAHTGWREVAGSWIYLHAGGGIGTGGTRSDVAVSLEGSLKNYNLPDPPTGDALQKSVEASLRLLDLGPAKVMGPLLAAAYRAVLGASQFTLFLLGPSGTFKTQLTALVQQHFGATMDASNLPGNWASTANYIESLGALAKDAVLVVDDFAPSDSNPAEASKMHAAAARVIRNAGNTQGRGRLRSDASQRPEKRPQCLFIVSGEQPPQGASIVARILAVPVACGDICSDKLTECQRDAGGGLYATAMAAYLKWLAGRLPQLQKRMQDERYVAPAGTEAPSERPGDEMYVVEQAPCDGSPGESGNASTLSPHRRTTVVGNELSFAAVCFLDFVAGLGFLSPDQMKGYRTKWIDGIHEAGEQHAQQQMLADPCERFLAGVRSVLGACKAHLIHGMGRSDPDILRGTGWPAGGDHGPSTPRIGYINGENVYLNVEAALTVVNANVSQGITLSKRALTTSLIVRGYAEAEDGARDSPLRRKTIHGRREGYLKCRLLDVTDAKPGTEDVPLWPPPMGPL